VIFLYPGGPSRLRPGWSVSALDQVPERRFRVARRPAVRASPAGPLAV